MKTKTTTKKKSTARKTPALLPTILNALEDLKAQQIVTLDVTGLTDVTDTLVIASGSSTRQVRAIAENAIEDSKKNGFLALGVEGIDGGEWVLVDFADVVLHVMLPETRAFYDLERLWLAPETTVAPVEKKPATAKTKAAPAVEEDIPVQTQGAKARARKVIPKPNAPKATATKSVKGATAGKPATSKAGVYAKTGTRKAASKSADKPAGRTKPVIKKTAATKSTASKPATSKPAASKSVASKPKASKPKSVSPKPKSAPAKPASKKPAGKSSSR